MFYRFFLAALELLPWLIRPLTEVLPGDEDPDNRGTMDPDG